MGSPYSKDTSPDHDNVGPRLVRFRTLSVDSRKRAVAPSGASPPCPAQVVEPVVVSRDSRIAAAAAELPDICPIRGGRASCLCPPRMEDSHARLSSAGCGNARCVGCLRPLLSANREHRFVRGWRDPREIPPRHSGQCENRGAPQAQGIVLNELSRRGVVLVGTSGGDESAAISRYRRNPNVLCLSHAWLRSPAR